MTGILTRMSAQLVPPRRASVGVIALWVLACLGAVAILLFSVAILVGLLLSLGLSETPPHGALGWVGTLLLFLAFAGLPPAAAYGVARVARRRFSGASLACMVIWTVPLTSLACWVAFWVTE